MPDAPPTVSRILVCQLSRLGDVLLATPAIACLVRAYPGAEVHVLTDSRAVPLLAGNPHVARIHAVANAEDSGPVRALRIALDITRGQGFDLVVDFQQTQLTRLTALLSGARMRIADAVPWYLRPFYTHTVARRPGYAARSKVDLLAPLGIPWLGERPRVYLDDADRERGRAVLGSLFPDAGRGTVVTVDATQGRVCRLWPAERFGRLLAMAGQEQPELVFLLLHGPGEETQASAVEETAVTAGLASDRVRRADAPLDLRTMAACIEAARLHVGTCSLPRHLAVAVGTPSLVVTGPTDEATWTYPWQERGGEPHVTAASPLECAPCAVSGSGGDCGEPRCMEALTVDMVAARLRRVLETEASI
jgi:heptosyltransferase-2/heptosyltransferase-3